MLEKRFHKINICILTLIMKSNVKHELKSSKRKNLNDLEIKYSVLNLVDQQFNQNRGRYITAIKLW